MKKFTLIAVLIAAFSFSAFTQANAQKNKKDYANHPYWIEMMQDPDANFYETVEAFNKYWENREITPGCGYKPFKRWEYYWATRINPDGTRRPADETFKSYFEFQKQNTAVRDNEFQGNWVNLGPVEQPGNSGTGQPNGNGRVNAIAFHPTDPDIIYVGAPAGGLWITNDGGQTWNSYTDNLPTLGVSAIAVNYNNPDIIYIGTGDRDAGDAVGMGVMKSTDGGITFDHSNEGMGDVTVGWLVIHPDFPEELLAATSGGIYKTTNGGTTWTLTKSGNFKHIVYKTDDPEIVFATSNGSFYRSTDGGDTWTKIPSVISNSSRGVIGVTPADPNVVYFHTVNGSAYNATYRSDDAGLTFSQKANSPNIMSWGCNGGSGGQGWYDLAVAVDPEDADVVYSGGVNAWKSTDGTASWFIRSHWYGDCGVAAVHADCHVMAYNPINNRLYAGNDGGLYWTDDGGVNWTEITSGLAISQVYKIGQARLNKDKVMNGYQDNGTATYLGEDNGFLTVMGGDGMDCAYDFEDDRYAYGEYYNGAGISKIFNNINQGSISNDISESGAWVTPLALNLTDPNNMFVGMKNVWLGKNIHGYYPEWSKITDFSTSSNQNVIEQSEADPNIFYIAYWNKKMFRSDNVLSDNPSWEDISGSMPATGVPTDIETDPFDPDIVYMTLAFKVYKSTDRGYTWEDITLNLPTASTNTIERYKLDDGGIYVGTDAGIYYKNDAMSDWIYFGEGFPVSAHVTEIEIYYDSADRSNDAVRASTYGRGLWSSTPFYASPVAEFKASDTLIPVGCALDFYDLSSGVPYEWQWTFEGATPSSSTDQNPAGIVYDQAGTYAVTLTVSNPADSDTKTITGYITVAEDVLPDIDFTVNDTVICSSTPVQFIDETSGCPTQWLWEFDPTTVTFVDGTDQNSENPVVEFDESGIYSVTLTVSNVAGQSSLTKDDYLYAGGSVLPFSEDFSGATFQEMGWTVKNFDGQITWELTTINDPDGDITATWMDFIDYVYFDARDRLISPLMNFEGFSNVYMTFKYAYAQRYYQKDSLLVKISSDCGESWTTVYANGPDGEGVFATAEKTTDFFIPQNYEEWCGAGYGAVCPILDLSEWAGQSNIRIAFESFNQYGNNLYITDVEISNAVGIFDKEKNMDNFVVYPNPASGSFNIRMDGGGINELILVNINGKVLQKIKSAETVVTMDVNGLSKGIYFLKVKGDSGTAVKKLIIQ